MAVFLSNKKSLESLELKGIVGVDRISGNDILGDMPEATASIGRYKFEKSFVLADWTFAYDEFQYIVKGSEKIESEGKTTIAREGDIIHVQKGTVGTVSSDEGCELILIIMPSLRTLGFLFKDYNKPQTSWGEAQCRSNNIARSTISPFINPLTCVQFTRLPQTPKAYFSPALCLKCNNFVL